MSGKCRPSLRAKTLLNVDRSNLSITDKKCIHAVFEKMIPKKPDYEADGYADGELVYDYAKCPVCEHDFEDGVNDWGCNYCQNCGQALDWSDYD